MFETEQLSRKNLLFGVLAFLALTVSLTVVIEAVGPERLRSSVEQAGPLAPLLYVLLRTLTYVIAPLSSGPLGFSAGILFGLWPGVALTLAGEVIGGSINFWISRRMGRPVIARFVGTKGVGRIERLYYTLGSPWMLVYARLFLFAAYDFISYAAGLTRIPYRAYLLITALVGIVPAVISVGIGASLTGDLQHLVLLYVALAVVSALTLLIYGRVQRYAQRLIPADPPAIPAEYDALAHS